MAEVDGGRVPERVIVVGNSCSGKSTLAQRLAAAIDGRFVELDALHWRPQWTPAPDDELLEQLAAIAAEERWVAAGNYSRLSEPTLWPRAELIVWLDLPLWRVTIPRMVRRTWQRWRTHELLWGTNYEDPWQHFRLWETDKNLFAFSVLNHGRRQRRLVDAMQDPRWAGARFVRLCSTREIEAFTRGFEERARAVA